MGTNALSQLNPYGALQLLGAVELSTIESNLGIIPQGAIGGITIAATLEEAFSDRLEVTDHPVETGAAISDHAYKRPAEIVLRCGWSNSSVQSLIGDGQSFFGDSSFLTTSDYVGVVYSKLLSLMQNRTLVTVVSTIRQYKSMLLVGLDLTRDKDTSQALMCTATCREVIIVSTQSATLAPLTSQADPPSTAEKVNAGPQSLKSAVPSPSGSVDLSGFL